MFGIAWLTWPILILMIQAVLGVAQIIVRLTPSGKDDVVLDNIEKALGLFVPGLVKSVVPNLSTDSKGNTVVDQTTVTVPEHTDPPVPSAVSATDPPHPNELKIILQAIAGAIKNAKGGK